MGKAAGAIGGGYAKDKAIKQGVTQGRAGYAEQAATIKAGKKEALGYLNPYADVGGGALGTLSTMLLGKSYDPETGEFTDVSAEDRYSDFEESPGYQFRMEEGLRALQNSQAAKGNIYSGRALKDLTKYGQGLASSEYGNYLNSIQQLVGVGQASSGQKANVATGAASQIGQAQLGSANLAMQGTIARGQNIADTLGTVGGQADTAAKGAGGYGALFGSDINLKENIKEVGKSESGITIYHFEYKDKSYGEGRFEGVMAQDLLESNPEAVINKEGTLMVDYDKIDVDFREVK